MKHLKEIRVKHGYTQNEIAKILGISRAAYTNIENGKREPDFDTLNKLSNIFNVPSDYLLDRNSEGWDSVIFPPDDSSAYDSILVTLLNAAHIFGKTEIESELRETNPPHERLIEIAQMCRYDAESFTRLISNCIEKSVYSVDTAVSFPLERTQQPTPVSESGRRINIVKIAGRDGSYMEKCLTDEQIKALQTIVDQMQEAPEDL